MGSGNNHPFLFKKIKDMACNDCKKKNQPENKVPINLDEMNFKLRNEIAFEQIGIDNPSDDLVKSFLNENPNGITLFSEYPSDWNQNNKSINDDK